LGGRYFEEIDHASDIGIRFTGRSIEELFENAAAGMFSMITDIKKVKKSRKMEIKLSAEKNDLEDMMMLWLEKLIYLFEIEEMVFSQFDVKITIKKERIYLYARIWGEKIDIGRHIIINSIKAPTYHLLKSEKNKNTGIWEGQVIFDV
jgi:SHS2 domain-containing protein